MIQCVFRPLTKPVQRPASGYKSCPFGASWTSTLDTMERELAHLKAKDIVVEIDVTLDKIRNDGWPKSTANPASPGVRISFACRHGSLSYECATYPHWEMNMRGIALTLERLRAIDRYGATKGAEQYKGWKQLPNGDGRAPIAGEEWSSVEEAILFLVRTASPKRQYTVEEVLREGWNNVYRTAAQIVHPDLCGGSQTLMTRVNRARDYIDRHLALTA